MFVHEAPHNSVGAKVPPSENGARQPYSPWVTPSEVGHDGGWGWMLGHTFLLLVHVGRKTGKLASGSSQAHTGYILGSAVEVMLLAAIVYYAWTWPKEA